MPRLISFLLLASCFLLPTSILAHGGINDEDLIIRMTKNGFEPKELTAVEGDTVLFINNDEKDRWPASNFHPTHSIYPEFDPEKAVKPGESWKFVFDKPGTWRMHDHLSPHITGVIIVLEDRDKEIISATSTDSNLEVNPPSGESWWLKIKNFFIKLFNIKKRNGPVIDKLLIEFKSLDEKDKYAWLENIAQTQSPEVAWRTIKETYNTPEGVVGNPHDMAHLVGQLLYQKHGFDGLKVCEPIFAFGCYHGLMEVAFDKDKPEEFPNKLSDAEKGCSKVAPKNSPSYWSCVHGIGHGIADFREYNLDKSLKDCDTMDKTVRTYCHDGVFMDFSINAKEGFYKRSDPLYPCNAVDESYKSSCARSQVQVMRLRLEKTTREISDACMESGNATIKYHCIDSLGYFVAQSSNYKSGQIISECRTIRDDPAVAQCLAASAGELVFQNSAGWDKAVKEICLSLEGPYRKACEQRVAEVKKSYGR